MDNKVLRTMFDLVVFSFDNRDSIPYDLTHYYEHSQKIVNVSKAHDITQLLALGLHKCNESCLDNEMMIAAFRYEKMNYDFEVICKALESFGVDFIPLKGSVIRDYYPKPWMRTSCDIDILIHEEDLNRVKDFLVNNYCYQYDCKKSHDISLFSSSGTHVELHYDLIEDFVSDKASIVLESIWEQAILKDGYKHYYQMDDKMFYFYHVAHMAKHFMIGGCGIRPFIDLWILNNQTDADFIGREQLLAKGGLLKFANKAKNLSEYWLENKVCDDVILEMECYIVKGGVYGSDENRIVVQQQKKGGRFKYALSKIFIPYDEIKFHYPILEKYKFLTPFMEVRRWFKLIFFGHLKRVSKELKYNSNISDEDVSSMKHFLNDIGL